MTPLADEVVRDAVRADIADAEGRASVDVQARAAKVAAETAEQALRRAGRRAVLGGVEDDPEVETELERLRAEHDRAAAHAEELETLSGSEVVTVADLDGADVAKWRRLIGATLVSATVHPGRGRERVVTKPRRQTLER